MKAAFLKIVSAASAREQGLTRYFTGKSCKNGHIAEKFMRALHLDHDHVSGAFRGWLCSNCNTGICLLGDNPTGIEAALKYLRKMGS